MFRPTKVVDVELSQPLAEIGGLGGYDAIWALVRLHGTPLGYTRLPVEGAYCPAARLGNAILEEHGMTIIHHLLGAGLATARAGELRIDDLLRISSPVYSGPWPVVTVAVCTRDRTADLSRCLDALCQLDYPELDLLVVDNAPADDSTRQLVGTRYPQVRYVCESRPGLDWARNRAITEAQGEIIAYTDDDVIVDAGWVQALVLVFAGQPDVMAVTGLVVPYELETKTQLLFEAYGGFGRGFKRQWYRVDGDRDGRTANRYGWAGQFGTGANMAFRRSLLERIGGFDVALDVGTVCNGGGDIEIFFRLLHEGYTLVYEPAAVVRHRHRRDYASLTKQLANNGTGFSAYLVRSAFAYPEERLAILRFWLAWLRWWHLPRLVRSFLGRESFPRDLILAEFHGYLTGLGRYRQAQRQATQIAREFGHLNMNRPRPELTA